MQQRRHLVGVLGVGKGDIVEPLNVFSCKVVETSENFGINYELIIHKHVDILLVLFMREI